MTPDQRRLPTSFSLYLDLIRFLAALLVVLTHFRQYKIVTDWQSHLLPNAGREAVIVFFVLSGFVIAYSTLSKEVSWREYAVARSARIYSVALPLLLLTFVAAGIATHFLRTEEIPSYQLDKAYIYIPFHLLFMGELWNLSDTPPLLPPYWSLSYEVWYYVLFGVACYLRGVPRLLVAALVLAIMGHKLWLLLPIWAAGVSLFNWLKNHTIPQRAAWFGWLASILLLVSYNLSGAEDKLRALSQAVWFVPQLKLGSADRVIADYAVCAIVVFNFACARFAGLSFLTRFSTQIRRLSFFTFPLYLAHALVLGLWRAYYPNGADSAVAVLPVSVLIAGFTWVLGHGSEALRLRMVAWSQGWREARPGKRHPAAAARHPKPDIFSRVRLADFSDPALPPETDTLQSFSRDGE